MKKIIKNLFYLFVLGLLVWSCDKDEELYPQLGSDPRNITEILSESSNFSSFHSTLKQFKLDSLLRSTTTYTVPAPENSAFSNADLSGLSEDELENVLLNHIIQTSTADFYKTIGTGYRTTMSTAGYDGSNISIFINADDVFQFNGVDVDDSNKDIGATNGIIHAVKNVLMPPSVVDHVRANPDFSSFVEALSRSDLSVSYNETLGGEGPFTTFAPTNAAFESFIMEVNGAFGWSTISDIPSDVLEEILQYHVIAGNNILSGDLDGTEQTTMQGGSFSVDGTVINDASYTDANISLVDIQGTNGVVHSVDKVLLSESTFQTILSATLDMVERSEDRGFTLFLAAVDKVGLSNSLSSDQLTAFATNDDAFIALFAISEKFESLDDFDTPEDIEILKKLVEYHLHSGLLKVSELTDGGKIATILGEDITADLKGDDPRLRPTFEEAIPSLIVTPNIGATNGILHEINRVLIPDSLVSALGIPTASGGVCPVGDPEMVFFDWDTNGSWWGAVQTENDAALSLDGSNYGRANLTSSGGGWNDMFWRNDASTFNGASTVGSNLNDYVLKFDINVIESINNGAFKIRFHDSDGVDAFYDWAPWQDSGEAYTTDGWETVEIPLSVLGQPDFSMVDNEFGMAFDDGGTAVVLNFAIDNVRFDIAGCGGTDPVANEDFVFFDWDGKDSWWGGVQTENDVAVSLDGSNYGRANLTSSGGGWNDMFWRNDASTFNGASAVGSNLNDYVLKFDINVMEAIGTGMFKIRFHDNDGVDAFYDWAPWNDSGEPWETSGWVTVTIPCSILGQPDFSLVDGEFGMAFDDGGTPVVLNFAIDNVRFEAK